MDKLIEQLQSRINEKALLEMASEALRRWASQHDENNVVPDSATLRLRSHKFCFKSSLVDYPYFESTFALVLNEEEIGRYTLISHLNGTVADDSYELY